jgi:hypothetical protein
VALEGAEAASAQDRVVEVEAVAVRVGAVAPTVAEVYGTRGSLPEGAEVVSAVVAVQEQEAAALAEAVVEERDLVVPVVVAPAAERV